MSIRIRFSLEPKRRLFSGVNWNIQSAEHMIKSTTKELGYFCFCLENFLIVQLCPEGFIWMKWNKGKIQGESQTNIAGPGFHAAVIDFLEEFARKEKMKIKIEDRTGYVIKRDFLAMRQKYFYQWFSEVIKLVSGWEESDESMFCWPAVYYVPEKQEGKLITHIRSFSFREMRGMIHSGMSVAFARDFFVWNEREKDAYFYRNSALVLLNQSCYFMPSIRSIEDQQVNQEILRLLEKAALLDSTIPFPKREYLEVCQLAEHNPLVMESVTSMPEDYAVGCRKRIVYRKVGNMSFGLPGNFLYDESDMGNMDHYFDGRDFGGHDYYVYGAVFEGRPAEFKQQWFEQGESEETLDFEIGEARARAVIYKPIEKKNQMLYMMSAQVLYKEQRMNINIICRKPNEKDWALALVKNIRITE